MVPRDEHDGCLGEGLPQSLELPERKHDCGVGRAHGVKEIARDEDGINAFRDDTIDRGTERIRDVCFALVDPSGRQPVVLPEA